MSSKRVEAYRRTTQRLLEQEREFAQAKAVISDQSAVRRVQVAAGLMANVAMELEPIEPGDATRLAMSLHLFAEKLSQRAVAGTASGTNSPRVTEPPAAAPVPSTVPSAADLNQHRAGMPGIPAGRDACATRKGDSL